MAYTVDMLLGKLCRSRSVYSGGRLLTLLIAEEEPRGLELAIDELRQSFARVLELRAIVDIDNGFAPDLFTEDGLQNILLSKRKRFDAFLRDNQPYAPKCSRIKGNPRDWYICPKTHDWHNNQCRECQNNLINEFRTGTDYRQGGLFFYCAYPRIIHEADKYGEVHLPSIRF